MLTKYSFLLLLLLSGVVFAQKVNFQKPDYKEIQKEISDKNSESYYPALLDKFKKRDTLLTHEQYRNLYYGYTL